LTNAGPPDSIPSGTAGRTGIDTAEILNSVGEVAYDWRIDTDALHWGANAAAVLLIPDIAAVSTGRAYAQVLEAENAQARFDAVMQSDKRDDGRGVAYQIQYCIRPDQTSDTRLWVEDIGRWFAGPDRKPARAHGVVRVINERYEHVRRLTYLARYDGLTGELNRHNLTEVLEDTIDEAIRLRSSCGFMLVAIDNVARMNESFGFDIADQVIGAVARRIRSRMRGKDTLGRFSGNKFGLVLRDCTPDDMAIAAERLLAGVHDDMVPTDAGPIAVTITIGGVTAPRHARGVAEVLGHAQETLDAAKARRRGSFLAYRPNIEREALRRDNVRATDEIVAALNERRIFLAYETIVKAADRRPAFYECLMRIRRTDGSLIDAGAAGELQRLGGVHHRSRLVGRSRLAVARACGRRRAPHRRDHRKRGDPGHRRNARFRLPRQRSRLPHRHRRFRRRLHFVPQSAQARRRYGQDRRCLRARHDALGRRPRLCAHFGRTRQAAEIDHRRRVGAGRGGGEDVAGLGLRLSARRADRPRFNRAAVARRLGKGRLGRRRLTTAI
jgi:diguanylate cyclase (GGDEF)-like protein